MRLLRSRRVLSPLTGCVLLLSGVGALVAQIPDSAARPRAAFVGIVRNSLDSTSVRSVDLRLMFVDSARTVRLRDGRDSVEVFVDSLKSRVGVSDSAGAFAIRQLRAGHYLLELRRIGFSPLSGVLTLDSTTVSTVLTMDVLSQLLAKVQITARAGKPLKEFLDRVGFTYRSMAGTGKYIDRAEIIRRPSLNVTDILATYGIRERADFILDRMPVDYDLLSSYSADLVVGIEIYRRSRPVEFAPPGRNRTTAGGIMSRPLVVIWTFIP